MALIRRTAREIRFVVAGSGKMDAYHTRSLLQLAAGQKEDYYKSGLREQVGKVRLCGLCDVDSRHAAAFPDIPFYTDCPALLENAKARQCILRTAPGRRNSCSRSA